MTKKSRAYSWHQTAEIILIHMKIKIKIKTDFKRNIPMIKMIKDLEFKINKKVNLQVIDTIKIWTEIIWNIKKNLKILKLIEICPKIQIQVFNN